LLDARINGKICGCLGVNLMMPLLAVLMVEMIND
jgi:hypothetical protein